MAVPGTRTQLKDYCLRRLGFPVIDINVDDDQLEDRIDDALTKFKDYHYDGTEQCYLAHKVTEADRNNKFITVSDNIVGISRVLPITGSSINSQGSSGFNIFDINYQIRLNDFYNLLSSSYTYYYIARQHLAMLDMLVTGEIPFTYTKTTNRVYLQMDWIGRLGVGDYVVFESFRIVDPELYNDVYSSQWLKEYTTALFKMQWGTNLTKYANYTLPGGIVVNGDKIYSDAVAEVATLEEKLRDIYEAPPAMFVG
jgi:hypothetical protein